MFWSISSSTKSMFEHWTILYIRQTFEHKICWGKFNNEKCIKTNDKTNERFYEIKFALFWVFFCDEKAQKSFARK